MWGSRVYNINADEEINEQDDETSDSDQDLPFTVQGKPSGYSLKREQFDAEDKSKIGYTTVAPTITPSKDPYRLVINYKYLNQSTHVDSYPLPDIKLLPNLERLSILLLLMR